jgi:hypothetical protein
MIDKNIVKLLYAFVISVCFFVIPAQGISISISTENTGLSETLSLDDSTSFIGNIVLGHGEIFHEKQATGSGNNEIMESIYGKEYSIANTIVGSGTISVSSSSMATADSGTISQDTRMSGDYGYLASSAISEGNDMHVLGEFSGDGGSLDANLISSFYSRAIIGGTASLAGVDCLDDSVLGNIASGSIAVSTEGLYTESECKNMQGGVGDFGFLAINKEHKLVKSDQESLILDYTADGGSQNAYKLSGWRWNALNPQIKMYLRNDAYLKNEKLDPISTASAVVSATKTWEAATTKNLFADTSIVTISTTKTADKYDGSNVIAFKPFTSTNAKALAYSRTYYTTTKVGGYYPAVESDLSFNTLFNWETAGTGSYYDVQTVALHELGHTLGLGDIYNDPILSADKSEIMNSYTGVKRTLGNGDKTGIWTLYG